MSEIYYWAVSVCLDIKTEPLTAAQNKRRQEKVTWIKFWLYDVRAWKKDLPVQASENRYKTTYVYGLDSRHLLV